MNVAQQAAAPHHLARLASLLVVSLASGMALAKGDAVDQPVGSDAHLGQLDRQLGDVVGHAAQMTAAKSARVVAAQTAWREHRRDCLDTGDTRQCLAERYALRIAVVAAASGWPPARPPIGLRCAGDPPRGFSINYFATEPSTVVVQRRDERIAMVQQPTGSGIRYEGGGGVYSEH
ncbi:MliC family protein [Sphingomonas bacterium]|uniref:MliC family protein n=1 Tax=Sphingomonas bacterium TaxID=1895847 RepID=UPI0015764B5F|nr:MliC family protein [Sphingomonas bacterium]